MPALLPAPDRLDERLDLDGIDFEAFRDQPLDDGTLRCLRYKHDVEHHTICYLRDVLVTRSHRDPAITTFMTFGADAARRVDTRVDRLPGLDGDLRGTGGRQHGPVQRPHRLRRPGLTTIRPALRAGPQRIPSRSTTGPAAGRCDRILGLGSHPRRWSPVDVPLEGHARAARP